MDLLTREPEMGPDHASTREPTGRARPARSSTPPAAAALAVLSLGAAVIHAAFAPGHFSESWSHGLFFAVLAWLQVGLAYFLLARPSRWVYVAGLFNIVVIAVWVMSRTVGVPFFPGAGTTEDVGFPDALTTGLEVFLVLGCAALLWRRTATWSRLGFKGVAFVAVAVAGLTTLSLTPRYAEAHDHGAVADGHDHSGATALAVGTSPCEKTGPPASEGTVTDAQGHSHRGPAVQEAMDQPTTMALQLQQAAARTVVDKYPTAADAMAAGYQRSTVYVPCIGAHYTNIGLVGKFDPAAPSELLYDGSDGNARIVGLSYLVLHPGGAPEGFAGPNDRWHQHNANGGLCFGKAGVIGAESLTPEECAARGGQKRELADIWMVHDWVVPGWECSWGAFAPECPELGGRAGGTAWDV
ncbi:MAG: hypothetical protein QOJ67_121 [Acidimicrobiaceae bacterium]|jgi:hypothetical protein